MSQKEQKYLELINSNQALIYKVAAVYTNTQEDKKDLVQEIYIQVWKSLDSFRGKSKISTWLYRVCMNTAIQFLKKQHRTAKHTLVEDFKSHDHQPDLVQTDEAWQSLLQAIQKLNELDKGIVLLYLEDKSHKEIAEIIGISVSNVGTRFKRIKKKLKKMNNSK